MLIGEIVVNLRMDGAQFLSQGAAAIAMANNVEQSFARAGASSDAVVRGVSAAIETITRMGQAAASAVNSAVNAVRVPTVSGGGGAAPGAAASSPTDSAGAAAATTAVGTAAQQAGAAVLSMKSQIRSAITDMGQLANHAVKQMGGTAKQITTQAGQVANAAVNAALGSTGRIVLAVGRIGAATVASAGMVGKQVATATGRISTGVIQAVSSASRAMITGVGGSIQAILRQVGGISRAMGTASRGLGAGFSGAAKGIQDTNKALQGTVSVSQSAGNGMGAFALKAAAAAAALYAVRQAYGLLTAGASMVASTERATAAFSVLAGGQKEGAELYRQVQKFALDTSFTIDDVTKATQGLLAANVAPGDITKNLEMLGNLAMGDTNKLGFLSKAMADVKNKGKLAGQEIRQFAENGVGIVNALAMDKFGNATAASTAKIMEMSEAGQISYDDMMKALESLTTGTGRFAGGLGEQSKTIGGMWGILTEQLSVLLRDLTTELFKAFDVKSLLQTAISWVGKLQESVVKFAAMFTAIAKQISLPMVAAFAMITVAALGMWAGVLGPFTAIPLLALGASVLLARYFGITFTEIAEWAMWLIDVVTFAFDNIGPISKLACDAMSLVFLKAWEDIKHIFSVNMPEMLDWFAQNWETIFTDIGKFTTTLFQNIAHNLGVAIQTMMFGIRTFHQQAVSKLSEIMIKMTIRDPEEQAGALAENRLIHQEKMAKLAGGKPTGQYRSMTEGMEAPTTPALSLTQRPQTDAERALELSVGTQIESLADSYTKFMEKANAPPDPEILAKLRSGTGGGEDPEGKGEKRSLAGAMDRGSKEAYSAIVQAMVGKDQSLEIAKKTEEHLAEINDKTIDGNYQKAPLEFVDEMTT